MTSTRYASPYFHINQQKHMNKPTIPSDSLKETISDLVSKCVKCRFCFSTCPVFEVSDGWITQGASGFTQSLFYGIKYDQLDESLRDILIRCTTCRSCEILCERLMAGVPLVQAIIMGKQLLMETGINPAKEQQKALESLQLRGNPFGKQPSKRTAWTGKQKVPLVEDRDTPIDTLYFVGCASSYDERLQSVSRAVAAVLESAGVEYGIMKDEKCSGDPARLMGEVDLFQELASENLEKFDKAGIKRIITTSPHDYHCLAFEYPDPIKEFEILHYTQLFERLLKERKLRAQQNVNLKVTYHDPCYLGKHHQVHSAPRSILNSIPGLELLDMKRNREDSLCCGGGGGRMWIDIEEQVHLANLRVEEALESGAQVLATSCPFCLQHFEDAVKTLNREGDIEVMDVAEILCAGLGVDITPA